MSNSKVQLLASMEQRETTQDWGAISIFSRARLNRLLEQQFVAGFDELSFLPPFSMEKIYLDTDQTEWISLDSLILSKPLLSFETASLDNSQATLTLGIMSGIVSVFTKPVGKPPSLLSSFKVSEQQGYTLVMTVNLSMVVGEVDARGRVTLDLRNSLSFKCNLAEQLHAQNRIGEAFEAFLKGLPRHKRVYELGTLALRGYNPLAPTHFFIRTQAAPQAKDVRSSNYGDGGVLIFIALKDKPSPGYFPGEGSDFPYFIPDDKDSQGNDLYSAALVLSHDMIRHVEQNRLDLLNNLLFPGENIFVESSRHMPRDLIVFGNIDPTLTSITLDPLFKVIRAGSTLQYTVKQAGRALKAAGVQWSVRSINSHSAAGSISSSGLYTGVNPQQLGKQTVRNVVTARYNDPASGQQRTGTALLTACGIVVTGCHDIAHGLLARYNDPASGQERRASALLAVTFEAITVAPQASIHYVGSSSRSVELFAVTLDGGDLKWTLLAPALGSLTANGARATYVPPEQMPHADGLAVQLIEVQDLRSGFKAQACVVLLSASQTLSVTPGYVPILGRSAKVQLTVDEQYPPENLRWSVTSGGGTVSASGEYSAPDQLESETSVVRCEVVFDDISLLSGYSVIQLSDFVQELSWTKLKNFQLTVPNNQRAAMRNGFQQIVVDVETETEPVNGEDMPVTEEEMSSLVIVHRDSGQALDYLPAGEKGIAEEATYRWAVSTEENGFNRLGGMTTTADERASKPFEIRSGVTRRRVYVHTRASDPVTFHARFWDEWNVEHNSNERSESAPHTVELVPVNVPQFERERYVFAPKRVAGGGNNPPQQEDYDYFLTTTDYWHLEFVGTDGNAVRFFRCEFEGNQSVIQWESRRVNETMFSCSGYIFNDEAIADDSKVMCFDERLAEVMPGATLNTEIVAGEEVGEGQLMLSLFRVDNVRYQASTTAQALETPLKIYLLDKNGNRHHLAIGFAAMEVADSRNKLLLSVL